jgi:hypothetical protein
MNYGVGKYETRKYWIDGLDSDYVTATHSATMSWELVAIVAKSNGQTSAQLIDFQHSTVKSLSLFEVVNGDLSLYQAALDANSYSYWGLWGLAVHFYPGTQTMMHYNYYGDLPQNYGWTRIHVFPSNFNPAISSFSTTNKAKARQSLIMHELGHGMGLSHRPDPTSVMVSYVSPTAPPDLITAPNSVDMSTIIHLYDADVYHP